MSTTLPDIHLDLGCGPVPRNPYARRQLCGVDIAPRVGLGDMARSSEPAIAPGIDMRRANLSVDPIPYPDDHFGSLSAFDFLEHVPRVLSTPDGSSTRFPFVELMDEIWRVLAPGGRFYALTPAFPRGQSFQDPTHVNFITDKTHHYFCLPDVEARMYGFGGCFRALQCSWVVRDDALTPGPRTLGQQWRHLRRQIKGRLTHLAWELEAVKTPSD